MGGQSALKCSLLIPLLWICLEVAAGAPVNAEVKRFPGYAGEMPSKHYAGYITLGDRYQRRHFYYYFATSEKNPSEDPLMIFLTGGPGCSGLSALVHILGPFRIENNDDFMENGTLIKLNPFSWTKVSNVIFLDAPTFTGYSYAETIEDFQIGEDEIISEWPTFASEIANSTNKGLHQLDAMDDTRSVADICDFIKKWFSEFPEYLSNPFYVAGSSYAGIYVAAVAHEIVKGIEMGIKPQINFKGYSAGNAAIDIEVENNAKVPFAHRMGFIPDELYEDLKRSCGGKYWTNYNPECLKNMQAFHKLIEGINPYHILCLPCHAVMGHNFLPYEYDSIKRYQNLSDKPPDSIYCYDHEERARRLFGPFSSRDILHADPEEITGKWTRCLDYPNYTRNFLSLIPYHLELTMKGYRAFIYTGDHDMVVPPDAIIESIKMLNYSVIDGWRPWFVDEHVAGYTVQYEHNLVFATFKGAGHTVPEYMPREAFVAHERWFSGKSL